MSAADDGRNYTDLQDLEAWLHALESIIALLAAQLPGPARQRFATAEGTAGRTPNTGARGSGKSVEGKLEGSGNFVAGKPGEPSKPGATTSGAGADARSTSSGDVAGTNASKKWYVWTKRKSTRE